MGRKKVEPEAAAPSLAEVVRAAWKELGQDAENKDVTEFVIAKVPGANKGSVDSQVSQQKKKVFGGGEETPTRRRGTTATASEPTIADLLKVKAAAERYDSPEAVLKQLRELETLASDV